MTPTISIVVPIYNVERWLEDCLDSVARQTFANFECILINDGSTDSSGTIAQRRAESDTRFKYINQPNGGLSAARNTGLEHVRGEWIYFLDSDDLLHPDALRILYDAAQRTSSPIACGSHLRCYTSADYFAAIADTYNCDTNTWTRRARLQGTPQLYGGYEATLHLFYQNSPLHHSAWGKLFASHLWRKMRFPVGKLYEDMATVYKTFLASDHIAYIDLPLMGYRHTPGSILNSFSMRRTDVLDIIDDIYNNLPKTDVAMRRAVTDRRLSAHFNILGLLSAQGAGIIDNAECIALRDRCWRVIRQHRWQSLLNPHVRLKNRLGILVSLLGQRTYCRIFTMHHTK